MMDDGGEKMTGQRFFAFEKLDIYHLSVDFAATIYRLTAGFPADERFGLTNQLRRASTSIALNIAEGSGRQSGKDFAHFLMQARGSAYEVMSALQLAARLGYLQPEQLSLPTEQAQTICAKVSALAQKKRAEP